MFIMGGGHIIKDRMHHAFSNNVKRDAKWNVLYCTIIATGINIVVVG